MARVCDSARQEAQGDPMRLAVHLVPAPERRNEKGTSQRIPREDDLCATFPFPGLPDKGFAGIPALLWGMSLPSPPFRPISMHSVRQRNRLQLAQTLLLPPSRL